MNSLFDGYTEWQGEIPHAADRRRWSRTAAACRPPMRSVISRNAAKYSLAPGIEVYEGMIVGENARDRTST